MKGLFAKIKEESNLRKDTIIDGEKNHILVLGFAAILILPFISTLFESNEYAHFVMTGRSIPLNEFLFKLLVFIGDMFAFFIAGYVLKNNQFLTKIFYTIGITKALVIFDFIWWEGRFEGSLMWILFFNILFVYIYNGIKK